jgi:uncharacterized protein (DUF433 family)
MKNFLQHINSSPEIRFGKPCIKGTRISVGDILSWLGSGMSIEEILHDFPELKKDDVLAALTYAAERERVTKIISA